MSSRINPMVVDLSHHNTITDFKKAYDWGIRGVIYKATEGVTYVDPTYKAMREKATKVGMLWGAYHFFKPGDITAQVKFFLKHADPKEGTLLVLDHEDQRCSAHDAEVFLRVLETLTGRKGMLYSGHLIKQQLGNQVNDYLKTCRLWLAQYGPKAECQATWNDWWLWQYTGDGIGPTPNDIPGLGNNIDVNSFDGTYEELVDQWVFGEGVSPAHVPGSVDVTRWAQATLNLLGRKPILLVDGNWGNRTKEAIASYQVDNELTVTNLLDMNTVEDMLDEIQKWNSKRTK